MKKYAIFTGDYSDWFCHGYFDNKDDAEKFCIINNRDNYYVKEIEEMKLSEKSKEIELFKLQDVSFNYDKSGKFKMRKELDNYVTQIDKKFHKTIVIDEMSHTIWFSYVSNDREKVKKIAQDVMGIIMYEYIQCNNIYEACEIIKDWNIV